MKQRLSFRTRALLWLGAALLIGLLLNVPGAYHQRHMNQRVQQIHQEIAAEVGSAPSIADISKALSTRGFAVTGPGPAYVNRMAGQALDADLGLSGGTAFWRPTTLRANVHIDVIGRFQHITWATRPFATGGFRSSRFDHVIVKYSGVPMALTMIGIIIAIFRREGRRQAGLCIECAYPIGFNAVCTECGASVRSRVQ